MVANLVGADVIINLTSADGVFDDNPLENPAARFVPIIENISELNLQSMCRGKTGAGTGGMLSKLMAARRAATIGVPTLIVFGSAEARAGAGVRSGRLGHLDRADAENAIGP